MRELIMKLIQLKIDRLTKRQEKINVTLEECYKALDRWENRN